MLRGSRDATRIFSSWRSVHFLIQHAYTFFELHTLNKYTDISFKLFSSTLQEPYSICGKKGKDSTTASTSKSKTKHDHWFSSTTFRTVLRSAYLRAWKGEFPKHPHNARKQICYPSIRGFHDGQRCLMNPEAHKIMAESQPQFPQKGKGLNDALLPLRNLWALKFMFTADQLLICPNSPWPYAHVFKVSYIIVSWGERVKNASAYARPQAVDSESLWVRSRHTGVIKMCRQGQEPRPELSKLIFPFLKLGPKSFRKIQRQSNVSLNLIQQKSGPRQGLFSL